MPYEDPMTSLEEIVEKEALVADINQILQKHGINESLLPSNIEMSDKTVCDPCRSDQESRLSNAIINFLWPSVESACVYHYTSREVAQKILNGRIFRLNNISKGFSDGEIRTFCDTHKINGNLEKDDNGVSENERLFAQNTFYASFTSTNNKVGSEEHFWKHFGPCDGVRLKIQITSFMPNLDFRRIYYEETKGEPIKIISDLTTLIQKKYNRAYFFKGISRFCSFYLSKEDYGIENEYRLLHRVWDGGGGPQPVIKGNCNYIELPLGIKSGKSSCGHELSILEVHGRERPDMPEEYTFSKRAT